MIEHETRGFVFRKGKISNRSSGDERLFRLDVANQNERRRDGQENGEQLDRILNDVSVIRVSDVIVISIGAGRHEFGEIEHCDDQHPDRKNGENDARDEQSDTFVEPKRTGRIDSNKQTRRKRFTRQRKERK